MGPRKGGQCGAAHGRADLVQVPGTWEDTPPPVAMRTERQSWGGGESPGGRTHRSLWAQLFPPSSGQQNLLGSWCEIQEEGPREGDGHEGRENTPPKPNEMKEEPEGWGVKSWGHPHLTHGGAVSKEDRRGAPG